MKLKNFLSIVALIFLSIVLVSCFNEKTETYKVTFYDWDNVVLKIQEVESGESATSPQDPIREGYNFNGWNKEFEIITSDLEVTATYDIRKYKISWKNYDGSLLLIDENVEWGSIPNYDGLMPDKLANSKFHYEFIGWNPQIAIVTENQEYMAHFKEIPIVYSVIFEDFNGHILKEDKVEHGLSATPPQDPLREGYDFIGWNKEFDNITSSLVVTAEYSAKVYTVVFKSEFNEIIATQESSYGSKINFPIAPEKTGYEFIGWFYGANINDKRFTNQDAVTSDLELIPKYEKKLLFVQFIDFDGTVFASEYVVFGTSASAPLTPVRELFTFIGWDKQYNDIRTDTIIKAEYQISNYTVAFDAQGGGKIDPITVEALTIIGLSKPTLENMVFIGWSDGINLYEDTYQVIKNTTLSAIWTNAVNYRISFDSNGGNEVDAIFVLTHDYVTSLPDADKTDYAFNGWTYLGKTIELPFKYTYNQDIMLKAQWSGAPKGLEFIVENNEATITDYIGDEETIILPDTINGYPITKIQDQAFKDNQTIKKVIIGKYVVEIGDEVFNNMSNLENIDFSNATKIFGTSIFKDSNSIKNITISSEATYSLQYYFGNDLNFVPPSLKTITYALGGDYIDKTLTQAPMGNVSLVLASDKTKIEDEQFRLSHITSIVIPKNVTEIGQYSFSSASSLTTVVFEEGSELTKIGNWAFFEVNSLVEILIPRNVEVIGSYAFYYAKGLKTIAFEKASKLTFIGESAFHYASSLTNIKIPTGVEVIGSSAFYGVGGFTNVEIPKTVKSIGLYAFSQTFNLTIYVEAASKPVGWDTWWNDSTATVIWGFLETINDGVVRYALSINGNAYVLGPLDNILTTDIIIPKTINGYTTSHITNGAFRKSTITSVFIPNSVTNIDYSAFYMAHMLTTVIFEEESQLKSIGSHAFTGASKMEDVIIPNSVLYMGFSVFTSGNFTIYVEIDSKPIGWDSNWNSTDKTVVWGYLETINEKSVKYALSSNGNAYVLGLSNNQTTTDIIIPQNIGRYIVTDIIGGAFRRANITSVIIPNSVTNIGSVAFSNVTGLKEVTFENNSQLARIGPSAFSDSINLEKIIIPNSVLNIGEFVFSGAIKLEIYAEAISKPDGWDPNWNNSNRPVTWGYNPESLV